MKFVVDTNICFSFFKQNSFTRNLIISAKFKLFAPQFVFTELDKYKDNILIKSKINSNEYDNLKKELQTYITFVDDTKYSSYFTKALEITPDEMDIDFFALAMHKNCTIWSNDKKLKEQVVVFIVSTTDISKEYF
jgi:predicted nucleic acid-binding protein